MTSSNECVRVAFVLSFVFVLAACGGSKDPQETCDSDESCDDGIECTIDRCVDGKCAYAPDDDLCPDDGNLCTTVRCDLEEGCVTSNMADGTTCPTGICHDGVCVECITSEDCDDGVSCTVASCVSGSCTIAADDDLCPADENPCTTVHCDAEQGCLTTNVADETSCPTGICHDGVCVECITSDHCDDGVTCTFASCIDGSCSFAPNDDLCTADENPCTTVHCDAVQGCVDTPVDDGTQCPDGLCKDGICDECGVALLWDNGPWITHEDENWSQMQINSLGMNVLGVGVKHGSFRIADSFTVDQPGWNLTSVTFFAYQTNSPTTSTFDFVNYRIWAGSPDQASSSLVFGDYVTNRILDTDFTGVYRVSENNLTDTSRPVMRIEADADVYLEPGTYWIAWELGGALSSGPWQLPVTIVGETTTGSAMQYVESNQSWNPFLDGGTSTPQGAPFQIHGVPAACVD